VEPGSHQGHVPTKVWGLDEGTETMNRTKNRRITHLWLTCGAGALASFAVLTDLSPTFAQGPMASRWSSAPAEPLANPATTPPQTYRVGDQAPGPTRLSSNPARPSLSDAQRMSEPPEEAHLVRLPPVDDAPVARRSVSDEPTAGLVRPTQESKSYASPDATPASPVANPASLVEIVPGRPRDEALAEEPKKPEPSSFVSRFSKANNSEPLAQSAFSGSPRTTVTDDAKPAQPEAPKPQASQQVAERITPSKPEPRQPANRIDWNHPQVVIGPAQPAGAPIQNQHVVQASGAAEEFFSFDPTRGNGAAESQQKAAAPTVTAEAPNQFAQGFESNEMKAWEMPATSPAASELKNPPERELSPITACRILGLKPATERR